jgi:hypothetical protein
MTGTIINIFAVLVGGAPGHYCHPDRVDIEFVGDMTAIPPRWLI